MPDRPEADAEPDIDRYRRELAERIVAMLPEVPEEAGVILAMADRIITLPARQRREGEAGPDAQYHAGE